MMEPEAVSGRFGHVMHPYTVAFTHREWAWEFLRQNSNFAADWRDARGHAVATETAPLRRTLFQRGGSGLLRWDCLHTDQPDLDGRAAGIFWTPEASADVLRMYAICKCKDLDTPPLFRLDDIACSVTILRMPDGVQHVLFQEDGHTLQVRIAGDAVDEPVYLFAEAILDPRQAPAHLRALRCFNELRHSGHLRARHFRPEPQGARLSEVLHAYELSRTVTAHRDIAVGLYGEARVEADWTDSHSGMQDHVRRTLKRAEGLVQGDYRSLLL